MQLNGEHRIPASRDAVWQALGDLATLRAAIPGCERLERTGDGGLDAVVAVEAGPAKATLEAHVTAASVEPPGRYTIAGEGDAGAIGSVKGSADVTLTEENGETVVGWTAEIEAAGMLASLGGGLIEPAAERHAHEFFTRLAAAIAAPSAAAAHGSPARPSATEDQTRSEAIETFGEQVIGNNVDLVEEIEEEIGLEAARGTWGGPVAWGLIAFAAVVLLLIALR